MALTSSPATDLTDALRRAGVGDVDDSGLARALYSSDASLYRVLPRAVVRPRHVDEMLTTLEACRSLGVPLTARGAGTSDRKSTRLNSSHANISYAVFCLKKKKTKTDIKRFGE